MSKRLLKNRISAVFKKYAWSSYLNLPILQARWDDLLHNHETSWRQKLWAHRRGFYSDRIAKFGLTESNYQEFLSDFAYQKLHRINGAYSRWIDDKLVIRYLLAPFKDYLPDYYFQAKKSQVTPLPDLPSGYAPSLEGIIRLLTDKGELAFKPMAGSHGIGFYKLSSSHQNYYINDKLVSRDELVSILDQEKDYILTEYVTSHEDIRRIYSGSPNTLRFLVIKPPQSPLIYSNAHLRFGTSASGVVDFTTDGGLFSTVDLETGRYSGCMKFMEHYAEKCDVHPDSGVAIEGVLPHLKNIKQVLQEISLYLPQIKFMGYDIIVTPESFKIIEINSHPALGPQQHHSPLFRDEETRQFFTDLINERRRG